MTLRPRGPDSASYPQFESVVRVLAEGVWEERPASAFEVRLGDYDGEGGEELGGGWLRTQ